MYNRRLLVAVEVVILLVGILKLLLCVVIFLLFIPRLLLVEFVNFKTENLASLVVFHFVNVDLRGFFGRTFGMEVVAFVAVFAVAFESGEVVRIESVPQVRVGRCFSKPVG